ncbi:LysR substrate-binding domain-containing protein [Photobacterium nomapromontoriensis]|uniref:LysR substrate-binding domain-containing protein n=1 Tax=Photobacterium nomapromontoriensis TaxID=2910237 RepID=UPI003D0DA792
MLPKIQQLKVITEVIKCGSINAAAKKMHLSQPSLTYSLKTLEQILGVPLLIRSNDGIKLTKEGKIFANKASAILEELETSVNEIMQITGEGKTKISFGLSPIIVVTILDSVLKSYKKTNPLTEINITEGQLSSLLPQLRSGKLDFAIGSLDEEIPSCEFIVEPLFSAPFAIVGRKDHPLSHSESISSLTDVEWLLPETEMGYYHTIKETFLENKVIKNTPIYSDSISCIMNIISNSDYLTVLSLARLRNDEHKNKYCTLNVKERLPISHYGLVRLKKRPLTLESQHFIEEIKYFSKQYGW